MKGAKFQSGRGPRGGRTQLAALAIASAALAAPAQAVRVGDVELPERWQIDGQDLTIQGAGAREYGFFRIAVYAAALYLPQPCSDPASLQALAPPALPAVLHLRMLRSVTRADGQKAWTHYLRSNCGEECHLDDAALQRFLALVPDAPAGDTQTYIWRASALAVLRNGQVLGVLDQPADRTVRRLVLASWIGPHPSTPALKRALLGEGRCQ